MAQVPGAPFFLHNYVKYWDVTLEFGQDISFVALVIVAMISELHEKLMSWPVQVPGAPFFLCN